MGIHALRRSTRRTAKVSYAVDPPDTPHNDDDNDDDKSPPATAKNSTSDDDLQSGNPDTPNDTHTGMESDRDREDDDSLDQYVEGPVIAPARNRKTAAKAACKAISKTATTTTKAIPKTKTTKPVRKKTARAASTKTNKGGKAIQKKGGRTKTAKDSPASQDEDTRHPYLSEIHPVDLYDLNDWRVASVMDY